MDVRAWAFWRNLGAFSGAFLMQAELSFKTIFMLLAIPALLSATALMVKSWAGLRTPRENAPENHELNKATQKHDGKAVA